MKNNLKQLLNDEICSKIKYLNSLNADTEEYKKCSEQIAKLTDRYIELEKINVEREKVNTEHEKVNTEHERVNVEREKVNVEREKVNVEREKVNVEREKIKHDVVDKKDIMFDHVMDVANIVVPTLLTIWGTFKTFEFEKTGTVTTILGKSFINKLSPRK